MKLSWDRIDQYSVFCYTGLCQEQKMYNVIKKLFFFSLVLLLSLVSSSIPTNLVVNMQFSGECRCLSHLIDLVVCRSPWTSPWLVPLSPIYKAENFWRGLDESGTRTKKIVLITHLHVLFSTVLNDVKLWFGTGKRLNISASVLDSCLVRMLLPL